MTSREVLQKKIVDLLKTLPQERLKHYASFKDIQIKRFSSPEMANVSEKDLQLQYISLRDLVNDKYKTYYALDDKLLRPKSNPEYYERLMSDVKGEKKETFLSAARTVLFGK